jgi:phosphatidate cytidylyltransferase
VRLAATRGLRLDGRVVSVGATAIAAAPALAAWIPAADAAPLATLGWAAAACGLVIVVVFAIEVSRYTPGDGGLERAAGHIAAVVAIGLPLAFMVGLRLLAAGSTRTLTPLCGLVPIVSLIAVVKTGDVAAYVVGTLAGRHRMAPQLSPGKTWEGAAGSIAASVAVAWLVIGRGGFPWAPFGGWAVYGLLVGLAGMLGDLSESLVKRECGAKDSGRSLGGMGGFLDFVDSLLLAAPVAWMLWAAG